MAVEQKKILIRRGNKADLVLTDLQPGEQVLALDTNEVGIKTSGGDMIWYATKESGPNAAVLKSELLNLVYPVGSIYMSISSTNPGTLFGGTWVAWGAGRVPVSVDANDTDFNAAEKTGGEKTHTLTILEMPNHDHYIRTNDNCAPGNQIGSPVPYDASGTTNRKTEAVVVGRHTIICHLMKLVICGNGQHNAIFLNRAIFRRKNRIFERKLYFERIYRKNQRWGCGNAEKVRCACEPDNRAGNPRNRVGQIFRR